MFSLYHYLSPCTISLYVCFYILPMIVATYLQLAATCVSITEHSGEKQCVEDPF